MPYTYYLRNKITGEKYYGVRFAKGCDPSELWVTYFSSSRHVRQRIKEYGSESFEFEVRRVFNRAQEARDWEERVLHRLRVIRRNGWLNKSMGGMSFREGPKSPEHREKLSAAGFIQNAERKRKGWRPRLRTQEEREAQSRRLTGVKKSPEHIANMKVHENNRETAKCPHCGKRGQYVNMKRWHFDNCKALGKERKLYTCPHCGVSKALPGVMRHHFDNCKKKD